MLKGWKGKLNIEQGGISLPDGAGFFFKKSDIVRKLDRFFWRDINSSVGGVVLSQ
jgi:hypothetical protein